MFLRDIRLQYFFLIFVCIWYQGNTGWEGTGMSWKVLSPPIFKQFALNWYYFFTKCLVELIRMKPSGPEVYQLSSVQSLSRVWLFATPWTAAYQAPPSMGFSRQEYWSGVPLPSLYVCLPPWYFGCKVASQN